jgi:hypothetical protein
LVSDYTFHEQFGQIGGGADAHDIAIVTLATSQSAPFAQLPTLGLNDERPREGGASLVNTGRREANAVCPWPHSPRASEGTPVLPQR